MAETGIQLDRRQLMLGSATIALASSFGLTACGRNLPVLALDGRVVTRDAPEFEQWRTGVIWQSRKPDRKPSLIVRPNSTAAVAAAVQYARANNLKISVKSSGHHIWGNFLRDDGMLIDMWNFRKVELVDDGLAAWIEPSVWSRDIMLELAKGGRAFPAAHCASVGMGGFLLGGGVGLNWDNWGGLSAHSILAAEVVTADGKIKVIDDRNEPDLAWALRGAGNGFPAIVTRFKVKTYPLPKYLKASTFFFPIAETPAALAWVESLSKSGKLSNCEPLIILGHNPGAPPGTPNEQAKVCIVRFNLFVDNAAVATAQLDAIGADPFVAKAGFKIEKEDWTFEQSFYGTLDFRNPLNYGHFGVDSIWTSQPEKALAVLANEFVKAPTPACHVVMSPLGKRPHPANAAARAHGSLYVGLYSVGSSSAEGEKAIGWLRETSKALAPYAAGRYINEIDAESDPAKVQSCYSDEDWKKIAQVRAKYDPSGLFQNYFGLSG